MLSWIIENIATIVIGFLLLVMIAAVVRGIVRNKKRGKSSCGCGCSRCAMAEYCHSEKQKKHE